MSSKVLILLFSLGASLAQLVSTPDGPIQGVEEQTSAGKTYYAYYSIPYAKPPIGSRRFLASEPVDPWTETHDGTQENPSICYQLYTDSEHETEDCLHLNVFTPQNPNSSVSENYAVIVYIHEGRYFAGSGLVSNGISPNYLINEDVILVSIDYRLGAFGFLSTNDKVIPGNAGLSDQIQALRWLQRNIAAFGGDPHSVTIMGHAAGASFPGYLMMTPAAKELFSAAIMVSGTPLAPWSYQRRSREYSFKLGSFINAQFDSNLNSSALLEALQEVDAEVVDDAALNFITFLLSQPDVAGNYPEEQGQFFTPVLDVFSATPMVNETQYEAFRLGRFNKVPIIMGATSEEGLINLNQNYLLEQYDNNSAYLVPQALHIDNKEDLAKIGSLIKQEYSPNSSFVENKLAAIQFFSEQNLDKSVVKHAELQSQFTDVYYFQFAYTGVMGGNKNNKYPGSGNVTHGEDIKYVFNAEDLSSYPENDQLMSRRLVRLWANFAKYHDPTPPPEPDDILDDLYWPRVYPDEFNYIRIGNFESTSLVAVPGRPKAARLAFWENLYDSYAVRPLDTY